MLTELTLPKGLARVVIIANGYNDVINFRLWRTLRIHVGQVLSQGSAIGQRFG